MATSINLEDLQVAIERLRPELPELLGVNYSAFVMELSSYLSMGSVNRLLDLFSRYPAAHNRLLDTLALVREDETTKGIHLFGDENIPWPCLYYRCESGPHVVALQEVEKRDAAGRALCQQHQIGMAPISPEDMWAAIGRWRLELPELLGTNYSAFAAKLDSVVWARSYDQLLKLLGDYPTAHKRLLEVLV